MQNLLEQTLIGFGKYWCTGRCRQGKKWSNVGIFFKISREQWPIGQSIHKRFYRDFYGEPVCRSCIPHMRRAGSQKAVK